MKKSIFNRIIPLLIITLLLNFVIVFAQGGEQSTSPGIPGQKPLNLSSVTLEDGSRIDVPEGITTKPRFKLTFDKNVVNMLNWENNAKCFSIVSESNQVVPVNVTKIDDTVDFSQRQNIFVQPSVELKSGTSYVIKISPELTAKNGIKLGGSTSGKEIAVNFKTKGQVPSVAVSPEKGTGEASITNKSGTSTGQFDSSKAPAPTDNSSKIAPAPSGGAETAKNAAGTNNVTNPAGTQNGVNTQENLNNKGVQGSINPLFNWGIAILVLVIAGWVGFEIIIRKRKNKGNV